jgi:hypothetical protein
VNDSGDGPAGPVRGSVLPSVGSSGVGSLTSLRVSTVEAPYGSSVLAAAGVMVDGVLVVV